MKSIISKQLWIHPISLIFPIDILHYFSFKYLFFLIIAKNNFPFFLLRHLLSLKFLYFFSFFQYFFSFFSINILFVESMTDRVSKQKKRSLHLRHF